MSATTVLGSLVLAFGTAHLVYVERLRRRLRRRHAEYWRQFVAAHSVPALEPFFRLAFQRFFYDRRYRELGDARTQALGDRAYAFLILSIAALLLAAAASLVS